MPYDKYTRNNDGTTTFSGNGLDDLMGYGPAADAHASSIDALSQPGALASNAGVQPAAPSFAIPGGAGAFGPPDPQLRAFAQAQTATDAVASQLPRPVPQSHASQSSFDSLAQIGTPEHLAQTAAEDAARGTPSGAAPASATPAANAVRVRMAPQAQQAAAGPTGTPVRHVAEHEQAVGRTTQRTVLPEEDKQNIDIGGGISINAAQQMTDAEKVQAEQIAAQKKLEVTNLEHQNQQMESREALRQASIRQRVDDMNKIQGDLSNETIDSSRYWTKKTDAEKFVAAISMALGTFAEIKGKTGSNPAVDLINKAVNDSISDQQANLANKRASANAQQTVLADYRSVLGDERAADAATRAHMLDMAAQRIDAIVGDNASPMVQARGEAAKAQIMNQVYEEKRKVNAYVEHSSYKTIAAHDEGGAAPDVPLVSVGETEYYPPGSHVGYSFTSHDDQKKAATMDQSYRADTRDAALIKDYLQNHQGDPAYAGPVNAATLRLADRTTQTMAGTERVTAKGALEAFKENVETGKHIPTDMLGGVSRVVDDTVKASQQARDDVLAGGTLIGRKIPSKEGKWVAPVIDTRARPGALDLKQEGQ